MYTYIAKELPIKYKYNKGVTWNIAQREVVFVFVFVSMATSLANDQAALQGLLDRTQI